ncbi:MAG TPA: hypothetical protein VFX35_11930 [Solirubrobacterales bacterium]|nr:hypothetical protein [Solirubrobacterales bacterium]
MFDGHPPAPWNHPWNDPLAPPDLLHPRPDADLAFLGGTGPQPEDFPYTEEGRRDYYTAASSAAHQMMMERQRHSAIVPRHDPQGTRYASRSARDSDLEIELLLLH